jgi:hypothetical protein
MVSAAKRAGADLPRTSLQVRVDVGQGTTSDVVIFWNCQREVGGD